MVKLKMKFLALIVFLCLVFLEQKKACDEVWGEIVAYDKANPHSFYVVMLNGNREVEVLTRSTSLDVGGNVLLVRQIAVITQSENYEIKGYKNQDEELTLVERDIPADRECRF